MRGDSFKAIEEAERDRCAKIARGLGQPEVARAILKAGKAKPVKKPKAVKDASAPIKEGDKVRVFFEGAWTLAEVLAVETNAICVHKSQTRWWLALGHRGTLWLPAGSPVPKPLGLKWRPDQRGEITAWDPESKVFFIVPKGTESLHADGHRLAVRLASPIRPRHGVIPEAGCEVLNRAAGYLVACIRSP